MIAEEHNVLSVLKFSCGPDYFSSVRVFSSCDTPCGWSAYSAHCFCCVMCATCFLRASTNTTLSAVPCNYAARRLHSCGVTQINKDPWRETRCLVFVSRQKFSSFYTRARAHARTPILYIQSILRLDFSLHGILCGCETWSVISRGEKRLRLSENRALGKIFG
jgi:hypothetical protein